MDRVTILRVPVQWPELRSKLTRLLSMQEGRDLRRTRFEWVYFIQAEHDPALIKIGRAYRIARRLSCLQNMSPVPLKVLALVIAPRGTEAAFHAIWQDRRIHGEWFYPDVDIIESAKRLPRAKRIDVPELIEFCAERGLDKAELRQFLYLGAKRKNRKRRRPLKPAECA